MPSKLEQLRQESPNSRLTDRELLYNEYDKTDKKILLNLLKNTHEGKNNLAMFDLEQLMLIGIILKLKKLQK